MGWSKKRTLTQSYSINLKVGSFYEKIAEILAEEFNNAVDNEEIFIEEADEYNVSMVGSYKCDCRTWYSPQTMWEPEEYEIERDYLSDSHGNKWIKALLERHAEELIHLIYIELDEDEEAICIDGCEDDFY